MTRHIFRHETNSMEEWLQVNDDGTVTYHVEASGWPMMRGGLNPRERTMSAEEAIAEWPAYAQAIRAAAQKT